MTGLICVRVTGEKAGKVAMGALPEGGFARIGPIRKFVCGSQPEKNENDPEKDKKKR